MAKIKKIDSQILHHSSKHVSGAVHPRLQKHVRQIPRVDARIARRKEDERLKRLKDKKSTKERDEHEKDIEEKARYDFPFDKGYQKWLEGELGFARLTGKQQQEIAESSKYQTAYEAQSGLSYKDGSKLGGGNSPIFSGFTSAYVTWISKQLGSHWATMEDAYKKDPNSMFGRMALNVLNNSKFQTQYTNETGETPSGNKGGSKAPSYTEEYRAWVRANLKPKSPSDEERMLGDGKAQTAYTNSTGKNPTG